MKSYFWMSLSIASLFLLMTGFGSVAIAGENFVPANRSGSSAYVGEYKDRPSPEDRKQKKEKRKESYFALEWKRSGFANLAMAGAQLRDKIIHAGDFIANQESAYRERNPSTK